MRRETIGVVLTVLALTACDAGPKAVSTKKPEAEQAAAPSSAAIAPDRYERRDEPVRLVAGKPIWTSNRRMSAEENARSHFERDGADFDAKTVEDFAAKAHAFTSRPPKGTQKISRSNGDVLLYDEKTNTFAVVARTGAPRTMFKPRDGADYWRRQVVKEKDRASRSRED